MSNQIRTILLMVVMFGCLLAMLIGFFVFVMPIGTNAMSSFFYLRTQLEPFNNPIPYEYARDNCDYVTSNLKTTSEFYLDPNHGFFYNGLYLKTEWKIMRQDGNWFCLKRIV